MACKINKNQILESEGNAYEKLRLLNIQKNEKKLRELGVKKVAKCLKGLAESKKVKKKTVKHKYTNEIDVDYNADDTGDDSEEDHQEVAIIADHVSKKRHHPQYIPPMSMKKIANLAKLQRVNAPKVSQKLQSGSNATKPNHQRATITMGQLISGNKAGAKRRMVLVDEDDDEDDEIVQGVNNLDLELDGVSDDENELNIQDDIDQDDQYEEMIHANNENETQMDDNENFENDDNDQEQLQGSELGKAIVISKSKARGPTMLHAVHTRSVHERKVIICNELGQPIGPVTAEKDVAGEFSRFLGTIARNYDYAPLTYASWHKVPHKDRIWQYVLEKYDVPDVARSWVLMTIGNAYKVHKCRFKKKHFYKYKDNKTRWKNKPKNVKDDDFSKLMSLWNNKNEAKRCLRAKEARMSQKNMHTAGPKSFARIRDEMKNDHPNKELPSLTQMFERTRKRTEGRTYADNYDDTAQKLDQMKKYKPIEEAGGSLDPFTAVMNKDRAGYRRLYGRGVSNKMIKNLDGGGLIESIKEDKLFAMQKAIEDDHEKKKAELQAMQEDQQKKKAELQAMQEDQQKQKVELEAKQRDIDKQQELLLKLMKQLPIDGRELQI